MSAILGRADTVPHTRGRGTVVVVVGRRIPGVEQHACFGGRDPPTAAGMSHDTVRYPGTALAGYAPTAPDRRTAGTNRIRV